MIQIKTRPVVLMILDGLGVAPQNPGNAVTLAKPANLEALWQRYPHCYLQASGNSVGLPYGVVGNSEVGHINIGAGKVVYQEITKIDKEISENIFMGNKTLNEAAEYLKKTQGKFHLMGLVSDGKVHSSLDHLIACLEFCSEVNIPKDKVFIHAFTDGRDTQPKDAEKFFSIVEKACKRCRRGKIASVIGRYYAMDRDNRWEKTQMAYDLIVHGKGTQVSTWQEALKISYDQQKTDEFIDPYVITDKGQPLTTVTSGDVLVFFNYRPDRAVQLAKAFEDDPFSGWQREKIKDLFFAGFSNYEKGIPMNRTKEDIETHGSESQMVHDLFQEDLKMSKEGFPKKQIFPPDRVEYSLGRLISDNGLKQLRITESEKYPHVTYFSNCRKNDPFPGEERIEIPSPRDVKTYDLKPEMSCYEVTNTLIQKLAENKYDFILVNFASTDMVPHTGNLQASIKAVQVVDQCMGQLAQAILALGGSAIITADHGNAEELINITTGEVDTEHSLNPVPFIVAGNNFSPQELHPGILADIAPTVLSLFGIQKAASMTGQSLLF
jgi:2,3-bisphosphoglycerate-independent phosphoglycerate mutase